MNITHIDVEASGDVLARAFQRLRRNKIPFILRTPIYRGSDPCIARFRVFSSRFMMETYPQIGGRAGYRLTIRQRDLALALLMTSGKTDGVK